MQFVESSNFDMSNERISSPRRDRYGRNDRLKSPENARRSRRDRSNSQDRKRRNSPSSREKRRQDRSTSRGRSRRQRSTSRENIRGRSSRQNRSTSRDNNRGRQQHQPYYDSRDRNTQRFPSPYYEKRAVEREKMDFNLWNRWPSPSPERLPSSSKSKSPETKKQHKKRKRKRSRSTEKYKKKKRKNSMDEEKKKKKKKEHKHRKEVKKHKSQKEKKRSTSVSSVESTVSLRVEEKVVSAAAEEEEELIGPQPLPKHQPTIKQMHYGGAMLKGEGAAIAQFVQNNMRIPRRGEIGWDGQVIEGLQSSGYVMSGERHASMNAVRIRKENQVFTAEEKKTMMLASIEEKEQKEQDIIGNFRAMLTEKLTKKHGNDVVEDAIGVTPRDDARN